MKIRDPRKNSIFNRKFDRVTVRGGDGSKDATAIRLHKRRVDLVKAFTRRHLGRSTSVFRGSGVPTFGMSYVYRRHVGRRSQSLRLGTGLQV